MMLKHICSLVAFFMMPLCVGAQNAKHFKYQGEINTSYSFCIDEELNNLNLEVINGVRFSPVFIFTLALVWEQQRI
ncbi:MAG: hypothetical protein SOY98_02830, partial [Candidatus Cryptobacteroides sp.]|nr:hypothetical protein [Candidatus Cryptobacteroides sp.]